MSIDRLTQAIVGTPSQTVVERNVPTAYRTRKAPPAPSLQGSKSSEPREGPGPITENPTPTPSA